MVSKATVMICDIDQASRQQLIDRILEVKDGRRIRFTRSWLNQQSTDRLGLLLLAAELYRACNKTESEQRPWQPGRDR